MIAAMNAVKNGEMGVNETATSHGVPKIMLQDRIKWYRVTH